MTTDGNFPQDVQELIGYFADAGERRSVRAITAEGTHVPVWILGSSLYGAQLAAHLGLPYSFASHFHPRCSTRRFTPIAVSSALPNSCESRI
ncbi:hypothetical protein [Rhizobium sp. P40RR-XXII]|uniref:hypothetical protein n=1 Tax=Rhizobium sp. P40RR-XXII TaxID=2726739 RepID=UPI0039181698